MIEFINNVEESFDLDLGCSCCDDGDSPGCDNGFDNTGGNGD
ncbi:MAG: hypothetical protein Q4D77_03185 [Peptostreptococcaceae bacterium]|nr:hypothetical protein [Peptostreptococcaceae bacterium]